MVFNFINFVWIILGVTLYFLYELFEVQRNNSAQISLAPIIEEEKLYIISVLIIRFIIAWILLSLFLYFQIWPSFYQFSWPLLPILIGIMPGVLLRLLISLLLFLQRICKVCPRFL